MKFWLIGNLIQLLVLSLLFVTNSKAQCTDKSIVFKGKSVIIDSSCYREIANNYNSQEQINETANQIIASQTKEIKFYKELFIVQAASAHLCDSVLVQERLLLDQTEKERNKEYEINTHLNEILDKERKKPLKYGIWGFIVGAVATAFTIIAIAR